MSFQRLTRPLSQGALYQPIAPRLLALGESEAVDTHRAIADRHAKARRLVSELEQKLKAAERSDQLAAHRAVATGGSVPPAAAPDLEEALEEAHRELAGCTSVLPDAAASLLAAVEDRAPEALAAVAKERAEQLEALGDNLEQLRDAVREIEVLGGEASWLQKVADGESVAPYREAPTSSLQRVSHALSAAAAELVRFNEDRERRERRRQAVDMKTGEELPKGSLQTF